MDSKWRDRYLDLARHIAGWSKDPSRQIGAVAIGSKGQVLSQGYNGFPRGVFDTEERYNDREEKYKYVVHAEMNVIYNASYSGVSLDSADLYVYVYQFVRSVQKVLFRWVSNVYLCVHRLVKHLTVGLSRGPVPFQCLKRQE